MGGAHSPFWSQELLQTVPAEAFPALTRAQWPWSFVHYFVCTLCSHYVQWLHTRSSLLNLAGAPGCAVRGFALDLHHRSHSVRESVLCSPSLPVLHRLQSHECGQNIPAMPETCASSEPQAADGTQSSSEDAPLSPGVWPGVAWQCVPALAPLWDIFAWFGCCSEPGSVGVCCL